ncbi:Branched-chain amino acid ABC transporter substrate-binding protein [Frankia sp. AiPs1]|uniref:ABC transporter substrate-binding protein n=1 Tax=Frankia sp. AiPa1 TaxID=573492 RepID=UPI00202B4881|nr:ABC transporter substrate-binding protein [Frankia sp. AiPa1]MCL9762756.1 ABC transporter substrate-binding protein [Frankia sp. AiPa1]
MTDRGAHLRRLLAAVVLLVLACAACSNSTDNGLPRQAADAAPGVTDTEIRFAALGTISNNPMGTCILTCYLEGARAYFAFRNSTGGVHGRRLVISRTVDDRFGEDQQGALQIVAANDTFATLSAPQIASGWHALSRAGIPVYGTPYNPAEMEGQQSIYTSTGARCITCTLRSYAYVAQLAGARRVAALGYGVTPSARQCTGSIRDSINRYAGATSQQVVYFNDSLPFGLANGVGPEVTAMKKAGVQVIMTCLDTNAAKTVALELERQGMHHVVLYLLNSYDQKFVRASGDLFEGDITGVYFRPFESRSTGTGLEDFNRWVSRTGGRPTELAMYGWIAADLAYRGILAAGEPFTRRSVVAATNRFTNYSADGVVNPIDWSRQHQAPTPDDPTTHDSKLECIALIRIGTGGSFGIAGATKDKPFACWSNADRGWSKPTPTSFP